MIRLRAGLDQYLVLCPSASIRKDLYSSIIWKLVFSCKWYCSREAVSGIKSIFTIFAELFYMYETDNVPYES